VAMARRYTCSHSEHRS